MSDESKPADALMVPVALAGGGDFRAKLIAIRSVATPLMGFKPGEDINVPWDVMGGYYFVRRGHDNANSLNFATDHPRAGESRFDWEVLPSGVKAGRLKPDPAAPA